MDAAFRALELEEQVSLLAGESFWSTVPVPGAGIPALKVSDGPNGARGGGALVGGVSAACFPAGISLGSSWDTELLSEVGQALADEAHSKGARVLLAPTVNLHRGALNGRNFECYSEDPYLTARLGVAYVQGLQSRSVAATIKHFVGNESEFERMSISSEISERALRELYLLPFEAAVRAGVWAVMCSYNKLGGIYTSEHERLLSDILRGEWGFDGLVMSDWFATHSTAPSVNAGLDLEMPGPTRFRGEKLLEAVENGSADKAAVARSAERLLKLFERVGAFENPDIPEERADDRPEHRALIRRADVSAERDVDGGGEGRVKRAARTLFILLLTGCVDYSVQIDFATDPRILRGNWLGADENGTVSFDLSATYIDETHYSVDGAATFKDGEAEAPVSGTVYGFRTTYLSAQSSVLPVRETFLADIGGATPRQLCLFLDDSGLTHSGFSASPGSFSVTDDVPSCPETSASSALTLRKK